MRTRDVQPLTREDFCELFRLAMEGTLSTEQQRTMALELERLRGTTRLTRDALLTASSFVGGHSPEESGTVQTYQLLQEGLARLEGAPGEVVALHIPACTVVSAAVRGEGVLGPGPTVMLNLPLGWRTRLPVSEEERQDAARLLHRDVDVTVLLVARLNSSESETQ